ncbi:MAG: CLC_0170 family protein [Tumebacillaceae bacterium]
MFQLSYINFLVILFLISGIFVLVFDTLVYKQQNQTKEEKVSRFLGWMNIALGILSYVGNWVIQMWIT